MHRKGLAMRANTITAKIEVPQVGAETQRPVGLTLNNRDNLSAKFQRDHRSRLLLARCSRILVGGVEHEHCP
jgi:hypothetical protein